MFSGIVETTSSVLAAKTRGTCRCVSICTPARWKPTIGESLSVDGICSTVVARGPNYFDVEYMPETLSKTTAGMFLPKRVVNLERSLKWNDRVHGHFVAGHIDARGKVIAIGKDGRSRIITISIPPELGKFIAPRGSIAVNGVSLTIARASRRRIEVALIPYTLRMTNLGVLKKGDEVNIECDLLARYVLGRGGGRVKRYAKRGVRKKA